MFEIIKLFIYRRNKFYHFGSIKNIDLLRLSFITFLILLVFCAKKPTTNDIQNIHSVQLKIKQSYSNVDEDIALPLKEILTEFFKKIDVEVVDQNEISDVVLNINIKGRPTKAVFKETYQATFYESSVVNGTAKLSIKGFSSKKVKLFGAKYYYSNNYYIHSNQDPRKPLETAARKAFIAMLIDLWGPNVLLNVEVTADQHINETIKDAPAAVPVLFQKLQSDELSQRKSAILLLDEFTKTKEYAVQGRVESKIVKMSSAMRKAVLKDLDPLIGAAKDENRMIAETALDILRRFGHDADAAIPVLKERINSGDGWVQVKAVQALGDIAQSQESVPILIDMLQDTTRNLRATAINALGSIGSEAKEAIPLIIQILEDEAESESIRTVAASAVGEFGTEANAAIPALIQALKSDTRLARKANEALESITGRNYGRSYQKWQSWWESQQKII